MVNYYVDTSAMLKQYVDEAGSPWLRGQVALATTVASSQLLIVETFSAFNRHVRDDGLSLVEYRRMRDIFLEDCRTTYRIVPPISPIVDLACALLERQSLRGYDSIHLATALTVQQALQRRNLSSLTFLCADERLNQAAAAEGLAVDNPNFH